ncbi:MAG: aromatic ring-hydroxylating dioxygenase subunit alpha [Leptospiraceae bacterium]|nr:aromatic ring-hydroxylating dioxygenase subunit alpha [Leptospiraceae bacterium]
MKLLYDYWYIACQSKQLKAAPLARCLLNTHLVLFRGPDGTPGALEDRCAHRNLALSRGVCTDRGLQCCYHGWTYDVTGRCVLIPADSMESPEENIRIRAFEVREKQGFLWVYMGAGRPRTEPLDFPLYAAHRVRHWVMERVFEGDALQCAENFLDVPHTIFVHKKLFRNESRQQLQFEVTGGRDFVQAEFFDEQPFDTFLGRLLIPRNERMVHTDRFQLPCTTRVDYYFSEQRRFVVMSQCTPISENRTRVFTYMVFRFDPIPRIIQWIYEPLSNRILDQDVEIIGRQSADMARFGGPDFRFQRADAIVKEIYQLAAGKYRPGKARRGAIWI